MSHKSSAARCSPLTAQCLMRWAVLWGCLLSSALQAQPPSVVSFPSENRELLEQLHDADRKATTEKWAEAIVDYQRLITDSGDQLVPVTATHWMALSWLCQTRLAALPPAGLQEYRKRSDPQARKRLEEGLAAQDQRMLRRIVREAFASGPGEEALDLLGDLAFARGHFEEAEYWWRLLASGAESGEQRAESQNKTVTGSGLSVPSYPLPTVDIPRVRAKQILARMMRGARQDWHGELEAYAKVHGAAEGHLAGRKGKYLDVLNSFAQQACRIAVPPGPIDWPTFAGAPSRNRVLVLGEKERERLLRVCQREPRWCFDLASGQIVPAADAARLAITAVAQRPTRQLLTHPILVGRHAFITDASTLWAVDLDKGQSKVLYQPVKTGRQTAAGSGGVPLSQAESSGRRQFQDPWTLSACQDRLVVCLASASQEKAANRAQGNRLMVIRWSSHVVEKSAAGLSTNVDWIARLPDKDPMWFEGSPLVHEGRVYVAVSEITDAETRTSVHCYALDSESEPTEQTEPYFADQTERPATACLLWQRTVCVLRGRSERQASSHLMLAGPNLVVCTPEGAVCALDALSGVPVWATLCGHEARRESHEVGETRYVPRSAAISTLYGDGRVYVAFPQARLIRCLDSVTGRTLWEKHDISVVDLLGVVEERLVFTTSRGIGACHIGTGTTIRSWFQPADGTTLVPWGRGFLAGGLVFWPTVQGVKVLNLADGQPADVDPTLYRHLRPGNIAYGNGYLLVADANKLWIYTPGDIAGLERRATGPGDRGKAPGDEREHKDNEQQR